MALEETIKEARKSILDKLNDIEETIKILESRVSNLEFEQNMIVGNVSKHDSQILDIGSILQRHKEMTSKIRSDIQEFEISTEYTTIPI